MNLRQRPSACPRAPLVGRRRQRSISDPLLRQRAAALAPPTGVGAAVVMVIQDLPIELQAHIALFAGVHNNLKVRTKLGDMLSLRCVSKASLEAVGRAAHNHPSCVRVMFEDRHYKAIPLHALETYGRVFGSGCREFYYWGPERGPHNHVIVPHLRDFITSYTRGRIVKMYIMRSAISEEVLLEICRACPLLKELSADREVPNLEPIKSHMLEFATELRRACPLLEDVNIPKYSDFSKAETYNMHFPQTFTLEFNDSRISGYEPSRLDQIEASAQCVGVKHIDLHGCHVSPALAELLLRSPLQSRVVRLCLAGGTHILPETILQCVVGFQALKELAFPSDFSGSPEFYTRIALARPSLNDISLGALSRDDDSCVAALCNNLALECLDLDGLDELTPAIIDIILQSKSATTLMFVSLYDVGVFTSSSILRLVRGCPKLCAVSVDYWKEPSWSAIRDGDNADELNRLLESRCRANPDPDWTFDEESDGFHLPEYGPETRPYIHRPDPAWEARYNGPSVFEAPGGGY